MFRAAALSSVTAPTRPATEARATPRISLPTRVRPRTFESSLQSGHESLGVPAGSVPQMSFGRETPTSLLSENQKVAVVHAGVSLDLSATHAAATRHEPARDSSRHGARYAGTRDWLWHQWQRHHRRRLQNRWVHRRRHHHSATARPAPRQASELRGERLHALGRPAGL